MKVDEQFKCKDCDNYNLCNYYNNRRETSFICKEFQNQWGFIEELEKIKAEISTLGFRYPAINSVDRLIESTVIIRILDNHIEDLKGDNNEIL